MKMNKIFLMFLLIITSSTIMGIKNNPLTPVSTSSGFKHNNPIVIFDASHQQFFNHTFMQSALDYIEDTFEAQIII
ncbi:MAG: hypothetical protein U9O98_01570, partial [Asgard group archaeon]|nr:hypothetical protein [Asgard group archaeon]